MTKKTSAPQLSVVIPVFNEAEILARAVRGLIAALSERPWSFEIILSENGSRDGTADIAAELGKNEPRLRLLRTPAPNYGRALRRGLEEARGEWVVCDEIDLCDVAFYERALPLLAEGADLVVGSKRHPDSHDDRPLVRRAGTTVINTLLRVGLGFRGTDTHGLKALNRQRLLPIVERCTVEHDLFASELVIRAARAGLDVREIPLRLQEIRPPSIHLFRRVPRVLKNLAKLVVVIRIGDKLRRR